MPAARPFFDSNVILYLLSPDTLKAGRAEVLLASEGTVSVQVLNEVASVGRRKFGLAWSELDELLGTVRAYCEVLDLTLQTHDDGLRISREQGLSLYDAMIVASALGSGCSVLYSEDMHHGLLIEKKLKLVNPFRD